MKRTVLVKQPMRPRGAASEPAGRLFLDSLSTLRTLRTKIIHNLSRRARCCAVLCETRPLKNKKLGSGSSPERPHGRKTAPVLQVRGQVHLLDMLSDQTSANSFAASAASASTLASFLAVERNAATTFSTRSTPITTIKPRIKAWSFIMSGIFPSWKTCTTW